MYGRPSWFICPPTLDMARHLIFLHSSGCVVVSPCGFNLNFPNDKRCWSFTNICICHMNIFYGEVSIHIFLIGLLVSLLLNCKGFLFCFVSVISIFIASNIYYFFVLWAFKILCNFLKIQVNNRQPHSPYDAVEHQNSFFLSSYNFVSVNQTLPISPPLSSHPLMATILLSTSVIYQLLNFFIFIYSYLYIF